MKNQTENRAKAWLTDNIKKYRQNIVFLTVLTVLSTVCSVGFAYLTRYLIDSATYGDKKGLILFSCAVLGLLSGRIALRAFITFYSEKCRVRISTDFKSKLFKKVLKSDYASVKDYHSGDIVARITADSNEIAGTTVGIMPQTVGIFIQVLGSISALCAIDWAFTLFLLIGGVIIIAVSAFLRKKTKWYHKKIMSLDASSKAFMQESVVSSLTVKAFGAEEKIASKADGILQEYTKSRLGRAKLNSFMGVLYSLITNFGLVFAIIWCAISLMSGNMEYGAILSIVLLMEQLQRPLNTVSAIMPAYYSRSASAERLFEIDSFKTEVCDTDEELSYGKIKGITVENAEFYYGKEKVLDGLNLDINTNETTCIYGVSGGGKSTLFKLLLGVYSLEKGKIAFKTDKGNVDITASHRGFFSFVPQGNFLFTGSVYENLTFFCDETNESVLKEKVKKAIDFSCSEFVYDLPNSLDTVLTEQGGGLSEGQRQRLAIARAFLSDRPILLLDESTSALDEETERRLIQNLKAMKDKTCIIISHRQAVIDGADKSVKI